MDAARLALVLDPAYTADLPTLPMEQLRERRATCQAIEVGLSYQRRMAQGRLDIVGAERNQRAGGAAAPHVGETTEELVEQLSSVLADRGRPAGFGRLPQLMVPDAADVSTAELDVIAPPSTIASLGDVDDAGLADLVEALSAYEREISDRRRALHDRIDGFQAEIARRYRTGEASVESLLR